MSHDLESWIMDISPINSQRDYRRALKRIEHLMTAKRGTPEGDCLDVLVTLIEAWERRHYPLDLPHPVEAHAAVVVKLVRMDGRNLTKPIW